MSDTIAPAAPAGPTFESVWALFQETREQMKETDRLIRELREDSKETGRLIRELREESKETDEQMKETGRLIRELREESKETDRRMKETDRQIGRLGNRIGELIEHLAASNLLAKFGEQGYTFTKISRDIRVKDPKKRLRAEVDLLLENGDYVMVVEVKSLLTKPDVMEHIERLGILREEADLHGDKRKYLGAVSGALTEEPAREYALGSGFYVIEQTGDRVTIQPPEHLRAW